MHIHPPIRAPLLTLTLYPFTVLPTEKGQKKKKEKKKKKTKNGQEKKINPWRQNLRQEGIQ